MFISVIIASNILCCYTHLSDATLVPRPYTLGTNKVSQVVVLNEHLCRQRDPHLQIEFDFVEKHIH